MKNLVLTIPFIKEVRKMRKAIEENLIDLMKQHGVSEVYCDEIEIKENETDGVTILKCRDITDECTASMVQVDTFQYFLPVVIPVHIIQGNYQTI